MAKKKKQKKKKLTIKAPNLAEAVFPIVGTSPYVQNAFAKKAQETMKQAQEAGSTKEKNKRKEAKNFKEAYEAAAHRSTDGWYGIPCAAFRAACTSACKMCGFAMTRAKLSIFCEPDGIDAVSKEGLVKITKGKPIYSEYHVRITGTTDLRPRPMWEPGWEAKVRIRYDQDQFTIDDVSNLMLRVGCQVGVGEGRADSKNSCGMGWGFFKLKGEPK